MSTWQEFYDQVRDPTWPDCESEDQFDQLPEHIQKECCDVFGYVPGSFRKTSKLKIAVFPFELPQPVNSNGIGAQCFLPQQKLPVVIEPIIIALTLSNLIFTTLHPS